MHRVVLILVIVFVILVFLGCLDMHIHSRPRPSSFAPEEADIDFDPENHLQAVLDQHPPGRVGGGWVVVVIEGDESAAGAEVAAANR